MSGLRIVFMGSPGFAVPSLEKIITSGHRLVGIVTQPDKPRGRGRSFLPTPVKQVALANNISPILQPEKLKEESFLDELLHLNADIFVVVAFRILPSVVFTMPSLGTVNVHPSLLPKYRGAAPINWQIINGEDETGITIIRITEMVDAGEILLQQKFEVYPDETAGELHDRLAKKGAELLVETIEKLQKNEIEPTIQKDALATPAPKIHRNDCHIRFDLPADRVKNWIHGLSPHPAAYAFYNSELIKFYRAKVIDTNFESKPPGTILDAGGNQLTVACKPGIIAILELQREGRKRMDASQFLRGRTLQEGRQFT